MRAETFWVIAGVAGVLFGGVVLIRKLRFQMLFRRAQDWPLTKGGFSGNYEDSGGRVIYYGYQVAGGYYSGVVSGSMLKMRLKSQLDSLKGNPAFIRYKPDQPKISTLLGSDQIQFPA